MTDSSIKEAKQLRRSIMEILYDTYRNKFGVSYLSLTTIAEECRVDIKEVAWNCGYLHGIGCIRFGTGEQTLHHVDGGWRIPASALITSHGIDVIEDTETFDTKFPIQMNQNITVHGDINAPIQGQGGTINTQYNVNNFFNELSENIKNNTSIPEAEKPSLLKKIGEVVNYPGVSDIIGGIIKSAWS
ncbi:MAG: hypothetical protein HQK96_20180 [Nitrospirae bacterium]|nr:hypothetical protein [Nitrospirota bacterium]